MYVSMYVCLYVLGTWDLSVFMEKKVVCIELVIFITGKGRNIFPQ